MSSSLPRDTTDPSTPEGDTANQPPWPRPGRTAQTVHGRRPGVAEDRSTTVALDPPGHRWQRRGGQVAVVVTGTVTVVTTDSGPAQRCRSTRRITLRWLIDDRLGPANASHWVVADVGTGS